MSMDAYISFAVKSHDACPNEAGYNLSTQFAVMDKGGGLIQFADHELMEKMLTPNPTITFYRPPALSPNATPEEKVAHARMVYDFHYGDAVDFIRKYPIKK